MSETESLNLYQKLAKIRAMSDVVVKDKKGFNYKYTDITAILANVTAGMKKYHVALIPTIVPGTGHVEQNVYVSTKIDKSGKPYEQTTTEMLFSADMIFKWVDEDNPEDHIDVPWFISGSQSDPSQAIGSGLTYTVRQFLTNYFQIATPENDVDAYRSKQKEAELSEDRAVAESIIENFDTIVRKYLAENEDKKEDVQKLVGRYVKGGNYKNIKDPTLAADLLEKFTALFIKE